MFRNVMSSKTFSIAMKMANIDNENSEFEMLRPAINGEMLLELTPRPATDESQNRPLQKIARTTSVPALRCWQVRMSRIWHATDLALAHGNGNIKEWWPASAEDEAVDAQRTGPLLGFRACGPRLRVEDAWQAGISTARREPPSPNVQWHDQGLEILQNSSLDVEWTSFDAFSHWDLSPMGNPAWPLEAPLAPARERELINHWATNLAHKMIPIRTPANPFLTTVSPMALEGSRLAKTRSTSTVALFHAVCAISAAHQANLRGTDAHAGYADLMLRHKQLSFHHLMQNMNCRDHDERMASLATLCLWILTHFITGTAGAWREVIKVTRDLLDDTSMETWRQSTTAALTYESCSSTFATVLAQYLGRLDAPVPMKTYLPDVELSKSQIMPVRSLELVCTFNAKLVHSPILVEEDLDQLEIEFALSTPEPSLDYDASNAESAMVHHHRSLFYHACLLYFKGNSGRRGPEEDVQDLVARCLDHMEHLESLQKNSSPKAWIYATVAFEARAPELRDRARLLFSRRKSLGIATWDTLLLAVEAIWKRRDLAAPGVLPEPWTRVLSRMPEFDVILY
ncbi:arginine metabolism regulation protein ii [Colletotrichum scovillei]|nr:arginine metabolism regulation protein ii [Colletotrichum scovillei]